MVIKVKTRKVTAEQLPTIELACSQLVSVAMATDLNVMSIQSGDGTKTGPKYLVFAINTEKPVEAIESLLSAIVCIRRSTKLTQKTQEYMDGVFRDYALQGKREDSQVQVAVDMMFRRFVNGEN